MHGKASAMFVRISPSKMRQVANVVRGMGINEALDTLKHMNKKAADTIYKVVYSALSNATHLATEEDPIDADKLFVETIYADEGPTMKRIRPRAQGRAFRIRKRTSHLHVELGQRGK
jgi:large subunit ribosomal protein L22